MSGIFDQESTAEQVLAGVDLSGKRALVTGVSAGLGVETARALAARGAHVVGAARDLEKAEAATRFIREQGLALELVQLDLASLASVRRCADRLLAEGEPFDLVIANAGIMACPLGKTADGFETQFGTNHLGHFVLINRLLPLLRRGSRVVNLSSAGHRYSDVDLDDPNFERTEYVPFVAYGRSKTANILFSVAFDRRHKAAGIRAVAVHPGGIATELGRYAYPTQEHLDRQVAVLNEANAKAGRPAFKLKSIPQGAATTVWAAAVADAELVGGRYCEDCHVGELNPSTDQLVLGGIRPYAIDAARAEALWAKSEEMVGERF